MLSHSPGRIVGDCTLEMSLCTAEWPLRGNWSEGIAAKKGQQLTLSLVTSASLEAGTTSKAALFIAPARLRGYS